LKNKYQANSVDTHEILNLLSLRLAIRKLSLSIIKVMPPKKRTTRKKRRASAKRGKGYTRTTGFYGFGRGTEKLYLDLRKNGTATATGTVAGASLSSLNTIAQGNGPSERKGRKVVVTKVSVRWLASLPATATQAPGQLRLILGIDKQCNGTALDPAVADNVGLIEETRPGSSDPVLGFYNLANSKRFTILYDKRVTLNAMTVNSTPLSGVVTKTGSVSKKLNLPIEFDPSATTGAISTIRSNNLFWIAICNTGNVSVETQTRIRYSDAWEKKIISTNIILRMYTLRLIINKKTLPEKDF